jgi:hypothetical protein
MRELKMAKVAREMREEACRESRTIRNLNKEGGK